MKSAFPFAFLFFAIARKSVQAEQRQGEQILGTPTFSMQTSANLGGLLCGGDASYAKLNTTALLGFNIPIQLSTTPLPVGTNVLFAENPISPGNSTTLLIYTDLAIPRFSGTFDLVGTAGPVVKTVRNSLIINTKAAIAPTLMAPANGATNIPLTGASFSWSSGNNEQVLFQFELSNSTGVVHRASTTATSYTLPSNVVLAAGSSYSWNVIAHSGCALFQPQDFEDYSSAESSVARNFSSAQSNQTKNLGL